ncbi:MAG: lysophospholipid acyltransferase family protein [Porphyromonas sp.]|nr:lysophospholipid acyltransferase family protein [Porphyromonas sp.]
MDVKQLLYWIYLVLIALPFFLVITVIAALCAAFGSILGAEWFFGYWPGKLWSQATLALMLIPVKVEGREYLPKDRPAVVTPNHTSAMDIFILYGYSGIRFKWVMKGSLRRVPFVGWACEKVGFIFVDSTPSGAKRVIEDCEKAIANGYHIFMFPEGSRTLTGHLGKLRKGAFIVAQETDSPIVPAKITGGYEILKRGTLNFKWGRMGLRFFQPIQPRSSDSIADLMERVRVKIQ